MYFVNLVTIVHLMLKILNKNYKFIIYKYNIYKDIKNIENI